MSENVLLGLTLLFACFLLLCPASLAQSTPPVRGAVVEVGGHEIHFFCSGSGPPTVIVENGLGDFSTDWILVQSRVARFTRICTYDRAGYAWSSPGPMPRTFDQLNLELHEGLRALGERQLFVLVGHSFGGPVVRHYAALYPGEVVGMVLVDTVQEDQRIPMGQRAARIRDFSSGRTIPPPRLQIRPEERSVRSAQASADGLDSFHLRLPKQNQLIDLWAGSQPSLKAAEDSQKDWSSEYLALMHSTPQKGILGSMPLIVLTRQQGYDKDLDVPAAELEKERLAGQRTLTELSLNSLQIIVPGGHQMHLESPDVVAGAILRVVEAVRTDKPLTNSAIKRSEDGA